MDKRQKRERKDNFTIEEMEKLIFLINTKKDVIENKESNAVTWQEKAKAWKAIERAYNSSEGDVYRNAKHLKLKYEGLKKIIRKKLFRAESCNPGDGSNISSLTLVEQRVMDMMTSPVEEDTPPGPLDPHFGGGTNKTSMTSVEQRLMDIIMSPVDREAPTTLHTRSGGGTKSSLSPVEQRVMDMIKSPVEGGTNPAPLDSLREGIYEDAPEDIQTPNKSIEALDNSVLRTKILSEELEAAVLRNQMLKEEMHHKRELYQMEKDHMALKMEILKLELQNRMKHVSIKDEVE